jgi:hypothetical protein
MFLQKQITLQQCVSCLDSDNGSGTIFRYPRRRLVVGDNKKLHDVGRTECQCNALLTSCEIRIWLDSALHTVSERLLNSEFSDFTAVSSRNQFSCYMTPRLWVGSSLRRFFIFPKNGFLAYCLVSTCMKHMRSWQFWTCQHISSPSCISTIHCSANCNSP